MRTKTLDDSSQASDPGGIRLSHEKMRQFHPEMYASGGFVGFLRRLSPLQKFWKIRAEEHLMHGDSRAALVVAVSPLVVAAYTDELDCVALLQFPDSLVQQYKLQLGTRLLTVNLYSRGLMLASDLENGPASHRRYNNFDPFIAEFLSNDKVRIEQRKREISDAEWTRTYQLARAYPSKFGRRFRDGRPKNCAKPA
jgi:hypothetical protein